MSSANPSEYQLPKIDFSMSDLNPRSTSWDLVRGDVMTALEEYECFEAVYDQLLDWELHASLFRAVKELFDLPEETKGHFTDTKRSYDGHVADLRFAPGYHAMGNNGVLDSPAIQNFTDLMWPNGNARFWSFSTSQFSFTSPAAFFDTITNSLRLDLHSEIAQSYSSKASELEKIVKRMSPRLLELDIVCEKDNTSSGLISFPGFFVRVEVQDGELRLVI